MLPPQLVPPLCWVRVVVVLSPPTLPQVPVLVFHQRLPTLLLVYCKDAAAELEAVRAKGEWKQVEMVVAVMNLRGASTTRSGCVQYLRVSTSTLTRRDGLQ